MASYSATGSLLMRDAFRLVIGRKIGPGPSSDKTLKSAWTYIGHSSMRRDELADLLAFAAVAEECSFTRAAARLSTSQSALSHTIKRLEARLGLRLLTRTT